MTIFEVQSGEKTYEVDAPNMDTAVRGIQEIIASADRGKGDRQPMAAGAVPHAMPPETVQGGPPAAMPSVGMDIADSAASRYQAGLLDIPGIPGDVVDLVDMGADAAARGVKQLFGASPEEMQKMRERQAAGGRSLSWLPRSQDIKDFVGFEPYQPQTDTGKTFDTWGGGAVELIPSVALTGGGSILKKGVEEGAKAALKQGAGDVLKYAVAPSVAGEAAGEATQGTALEPWARLGAALATGGAAGAKRAMVKGAPSVEEWRTAGSQFYDDMKAAGVGVKPSSFDQMVSDAEHALHVEGYRPALHPNVKAVLDDMKASKGVPQSFEELDQMHRLATRQMGNIDKDTARVAGILADKIDNYMESLKPRDLIAKGDPKTAFNVLVKGRDAWRKFRSGQRIANIIEGAKDTLGANYTSAGMQTALRQAFKRYKWKGGVGKEYSRDYKTLASHEKAVVNSIIRGVSVENALRLVGKFNVRNPFAVSILTAMGLTGNAVLGGGLLAMGEGARRLSARGTITKANQLGEMVRGGKVTPGRWGRPPNAIFYGTDAQRSADQSREGR